MQRSAAHKCFDYSQHYRPHKYVEGRLREQGG